MTKAKGGRNGHKPADAELKPATKVTIGGRDPQAHHGYVNPAYHAFTLPYRTAEDCLARGGRYRYGRLGRPASEALDGGDLMADLMADLERGLAALAAAK